MNNMGFNNKHGLKIMKEFLEKELKDELKANRKRNGPWRSIQSFPCPCQCIAMRSVKPRGEEKLYRSNENHIIYRNIPTKSGWETEDRRYITETEKHEILMKAK